MQTIQLDFQNDKLDIDSLKNCIVESIKKDSKDYLDIEQTKKENNPKYTIAESKTKLFS